MRQQEAVFEAIRANRRARLEQEMHIRLNIHRRDLRRLLAGDDGQALEGQRNIIVVRPGEPGQPPPELVVDLVEVDD
jgi:hypothetical protein